MNTVRMAQTTKGIGRAVSASSLADIAEAVRAVFMLFGCSLALRWIPFRRIHAWHNQHNHCAIAVPADHAKHVARIVRAIRRASRVVGISACLSQALTAQMLLRWVGVPSRVWFGVNPSVDSQFAAHAWLEWNGQTVLGGWVQATYAPLFSLDVAPHIQSER